MGGTNLNTAAASIDNAGAATVTSLNAGNGLIETTGDLEAGTATIGVIDGTTASYDTVETNLLTDNGGPNGLQIQSTTIDSDSTGGSITSTVTDLGGATA